MSKFNYKGIAAYYDYDYYNKKGIKSGYENMLDCLGGPWHDEACGWFNSVIPVKGLKIFDAGCGLGHFMTGFKRLGADVYGCDVSFYCSSVMKKNFPGHFWRTRLEDMGDVPNLDYDIIFCESTMEHISLNAINLVFDNFLWLAKPGGLIYLQIDTIPDSKRDMPEESHICLRPWSAWLKEIQRRIYNWSPQYTLVEELKTTKAFPGFPLNDWRFMVLKKS